MVITLGSIAFKEAQARAFSSFDSACSYDRSAWSQGIWTSSLVLSRFTFLRARADLRFLRHDRRFRQLHLPRVPRPPADEVVPFRSPQAVNALSGVL
jgi:hypothetical protein